MRLHEICDFLEQQFPLALQESYDNSGLLYGRLDWEIHGALLCLDSTEAIVDEAIANKCNLIIAHHPIVFKGLKSLTGRTYVERVVEKCIQHRIALYAIHTNLDNHPAGVNAAIGQRLGLENLRILSPMKQQLSKLITYVPNTHLAQIDEAVFSAGAGHIGNYTACHFRSEGIGTFQPLDGAKPRIGKVNERSQVEELKIEYLVPNFALASVVRALKKAHLYEEVAYDIVALSNVHQDFGAGMIGNLPEEMPAIEFLKKVKRDFECGCIRHTPLSDKPIKKVAFCGGAGSFLLPDAIKAGADIYITGDFKYHEFFDAENQIVIADIGHYESEQFTSAWLAEKIKENFPNFALRLTKLNTNPINYL
ncbi:MAG: hypothetical protein RLZZ301_1413 [Bacteroidota bacterium]|jgi:dinuclear metal center YbgI/SA1388 family protein